MNYAKIYEQFIADRRTKEDALVGYTEKHHIIPRSLGGDNSKENLIALNPSDHLFAHLLLAVIHGKDMWLPVVRMSKIPKHILNKYGDIKVTGKFRRLAFAMARKNHAKHLSKKKSGKSVPQFVEQHKNQENKTIYQWKNTKTGENFKGTLRQLSEKSGIKTNKLSSVVSNHTTSFHGWTLFDREIESTVDRVKKIARIPRTWFVNCETGEKVFSSPALLSDKYGIAITLLSHAERGNGSAKGWIKEGSIITSGKFATVPHVKSNKTIFDLVNVKTGEKVSGTICDLRKIFGGRSFEDVLRGVTKVNRKGWTLALKEAA